MENRLNRVSPQLKKSLELWYHLSAAALIITLMSCAAVHFFLVRSLTRATQNFPLTMKSEVCDEQELFQKKIDELDSFLQKQPVVLSLLEQSIDKLPTDIQLTQFIITADKTVSCSGAASDMASISECIAALQACGLACTTVTTKQDYEKDLPLRITIKAQACLKNDPKESTIDDTH